jgi:NHLM bacteriocin system ABC transporter ATP-binding protein
VALLPLSSRSYQIMDPRTGVRARLDARTAAALDSRGYVFCRPFPQRLQGAVDLVQFALRGRSRDLLWILATACAATLLGMLAPLALAVIVDHAIPNAYGTLLVEMGLGLLAAAVGAAIFRLSQGIALLRLQTTVDVATQSAVWDRLLNLPLPFFRDYSTGDLEARVNAIAEIRSRLGGTTLRTLFSSVLLLLNLGLLLYYSPLLAVVALVAAVCIAAVTVVSGIWVLRCWRQVLQLRGRFQGLMVQLINGIAKLRVAAAEERAFARWAREYAPLLRLELKQRRIQDVVQVINMAATALSFIVLFAIAAHLAREQSLTTGAFLAFSLAFGTFIGATSSVSNLVTDLMVIAILQERARPILTAAPEVGERQAHPGPLRGQLEVERVVFRYQPDGALILDDVSLRARAGEFIALVGASGCGKSTLVRLLLGLERPQSGSIYYDGQDLAGLDLYAVRRQLGVVLQNGSINAGSIFDNIAAGTQVTLNDTWEAARAAGFADDLEAMPMGLHTIVSEGATNLSGGQRQRLLLARAIVHRPRILLLDEATSALDNHTQAIVSESIAALQITRLVIAHRLTTIRNADRIYVMDAGRIVEQGTYDELQRRQGSFASLISRQLAS